jgi:hypothetical protein
MTKGLITNEQIIKRLTEDLEELLPMQAEHDGAIDGYGEYISGVIARTQTVLMMLGVPEEQIPNDGSC